MFDRAILKTNAKSVLANSYWLSFAVCLLASLFGTGVGSYTASARNSGSGASSSYSYRYNYNHNYWGWVVGAAFIVLLLALAITLVYSIFVGHILTVGKCAFFIRTPYGEKEFGNLLYGFKNGRYMGIVKAMFLTNLYIWLWSLLLVIPGIVKSYQYRFVPYLLAENPDLSAEQAMAISTQMSSGQKWEMFVLDLSFFGWRLLGALACGVGLWFVQPYVEATWAQLYISMRQNAQAPPPTDYPTQPFPPYPPTGPGGSQYYQPPQYGQPPYGQQYGTPPQGQPPQYPTGAPQQSWPGYPPQGGQQTFAPYGQQPPYGSQPYGQQGTPPPQGGQPQYQPPGYPGYPPQQQSYNPQATGWQQPPNPGPTAPPPNSPYAPQDAQEPREGK